MSVFPHPWYLAYSDMGPMALCVDEWVIVKMSAYIRSKPGWTQHRKYGGVVAKWRQELSLLFESQLLPFDELFDYVIRELQWYANLQAGEGIGDNGFTIEFDDKVLVSGWAVDNDTKLQLQSASKALYQLLGNHLDYRPGTDRQVVDLVHPSVYPLQYGKTPILKQNKLQMSAYDPKIMTFKPGVAPNFHYKSFQWLPSLFCLDSTGAYTLQSYINNLHPKNSQLYTLIEQVFNASVPALELMLSRYQSDQLIRIQVPRGSDAYLAEFNEKMNQFWQNPENLKKTNFAARLDSLMAEKPHHVSPVTLEYKQPETKHLNLKQNFETLKVIVKLSNVELTPENPSYRGGSWHVDGTINEDIVASIHYCYDCENVTDSKISFRCTFDEPYYEQDDDFYCDHFYGLNNDVPMNRRIGSIKTGEGLLLVFPNIFQHHIDGFELKDKTKPGHKKLLSLFLVDPHNDLVITTKDVPPQQQQWWEDSESLGDILSPDLKRDIVSLTENWPKSLEEADKIRCQLMDERTLAVQDEVLRYRAGLQRENVKVGGIDIDDDLVPPFDRYFSLCEH